MKKIIYLSAIVCIISSCSKESPSIPDPNSAPTISAVPAHFDQKVVIENFTQAQCGQCPRANLILDSLIRFNPDKVYGLTYHVDDVMEDTSMLTTNGRNYYDSIFNPTGVYPSGLVNRHLASLNDLSPDLWSGSIFTELSHVPSCGVALEAENIVNGILNLKVHAGFCTQMFGEYRINVFIVSDQIVSNDSLYLQINDFSSQGASPDTSLSLYALNDSIHPYTHKYVMKRVATPAGVDGDPIPTGAMTPGNDYSVVYPITVAGIDTEHSYILVYIDKHATTLTGHWIENVQVVRFGESKDWN